MKFKLWLQRIARWRPARSTTAYFMMVSFILFTAVGGFLIAPPIGFLVAGISCGIFGYILGAE